MCVVYRDKHGSMYAKTGGEFHRIFKTGYNPLISDRLKTRQVTPVVAKRLVNALKLHDPGRASRLEYLADKCGLRPTGRQEKLGDLTLEELKCGYHDELVFLVNKTLEELFFSQVSCENLEDAIASRFSPVAGVV